MQLVVLANEILKEELLSNGAANETEIVWIDRVEEFTNYKNADGYVDLLFENIRSRIELLKSLSFKAIIVNSVVDTLKSMDAPFIRINAWPGFLKRQLVEACSIDETIKKEAEKIFELLNKKIEWVPDKPGFVTARVISMIINEAWFALQEGISTKQEIDIAMKLGTNYPYGPFEWGDKIGLKNIYRLLKEMSGENSKYQPAELLEKANL
jgi:3-hydroxybutyryl-CoA dehydrogenase